MTPLKDWIDKKIKDEDITYFEYSELSNFVEIGRGGFGIVNKADLTGRGIKVALKSLLTMNKNEINQLVKEV